MKTRTVVLGMALFLAACISHPEPWVPTGDVADAGKDDQEQGSDGKVEVAPGDVQTGEDIKDIPKPDVPAYVVVPPDVVDATTPPDLHDVAVDQVEEVLPEVMDLLDEEVCQPQCGDNDCGDDGCGGSCGECKEENESCILGHCHPNYCTEGLQDFGCCFGDVLFWCEEEELKWTDCSGNNSPFDVCGWDDNEYTCGGEGEDPDDVHPLECCTVDCEGKVCGTDGCWGSCGECGDNEECTEGVCGCVQDSAPCNEVCCPVGEVCFEDACCLADCDGKECGDDGCGGSCGECGDNEACKEGNCGCILDSVLCNDVCCLVGQVCFDETCCSIDCDGKECGANGCGGRCGGCGENEECKEGTCGCIADSMLCDDICCTVGQVCFGEACCGADCDGKECGADGCGGSCGECGDNEECTEGTCGCIQESVLCGEVCCQVGQVCFTGGCCTADCDGKECGDDGCGGSCGACGELETCEPSLGACTTTMVSIPAGSFWMGCNNWEGSTVKDEDCLDVEHPYHLVLLAPYTIDVAEVTASQFATCVEAGGGCNPLEDSDCWAGTTNYGKDGLEEHPINCVGWSQAKTYCEWAGKQLCTEAQWEKAARGGCEFYDDCKAETRKYPWGNEAPSCARAVSWGCQCQAGTCPVGTHPAGDSPYGVHDMAGNVWEFTADWYAGDYYCKGPDSVCTSLCDDCVSQKPYEEPVWANPEGPPWVGGTYRIEKGGGYSYTETFELRASNRSAYTPNDVTSYGAVGFRCCSSSCGDGSCDEFAGEDCTNCQSDCACTGDDICFAGACCTPACNGKQCGGNGCGGECGTCTGLQDECIGGACICQPECDGKECGDDGCGGSCGECESSWLCNVDQQCFDPWAGTVWTDPESGLMWESAPSGGSGYWSNMKEHCSSLSLANHSDWRMPNIDEIRSLIRGCPATAFNSSQCNIKEGGCLASSCKDDSCAGCPIGEGPAEGYYRPDEVDLGGSFYWSTSLEPDYGSVWGVQFDMGVVTPTPPDHSPWPVVCVR